MSHDPVTGPLTRERLRELAAMPFGAAIKEIRKIDPYYGLKDGEKIEFEVTVTGRLQGRAWVKASSKEEAEKLADKLNEGDCDWGGYSCDDFEIIDVQPMVQR